MNHRHLTLTPYHHHRKNHPLEVQLREIEVLIISAENLKNVNHVTKIKPYCLVYVEKDVHIAQTHVDHHRGTDPTWNETVKVSFRQELLETDVRAALNIDIYSHGHLRDKLVGSCRVLLCDVLKGGKPDEPADNPIQCMMVQVWRASGRPRGLLNLWVPRTGKFLLRKDSSDSFNVEKGGVEKDEVAVDGGGGDGTV